MTLEQFGLIVVGVCLTVLLIVICAVSRPLITRMRLRRTIEYRTIARVFNTIWPGFPGCICLRASDVRRGVDHVGIPCLAKKHRK